jgi:hypothetical protein
VSASIHVDQGCQGHADLADPVEGPYGEVGGAENSIYLHERHDRDHPQAEEIGAVGALQTAVDLLQSRREFVAQRVVEQEPGGEKGQGGAEG